MTRPDRYRVVVEANGDSLERALNLVAKEGYAILECAYDQQRSTFWVVLEHEDYGE